MYKETLKTKVSMNPINLLHAKVKRNKNIKIFDQVRLCLGILLSIILLWTIIDKLSNYSFYIPSLFRNPFWKLGVSTFCIFLYGYDLPYKAYREIKARKIGSNIFKFLSLTTAFVFSLTYLLINLEGSVFQGEKDYIFFDANAEILIILFFSHYIYKYGRTNSYENLDLMKGISEYEYLTLIDNDEVRILGQDIRKNSILKILPGQIVPTDGEVLSGTSSINNTLFFGKKKGKQLKTVGSNIYCGTLVEDSALIIRSTKNIYNSKISYFMKNKSMNKDIKMNIEKVIDKYSKYLLPTFLFASFLAFILWGAIRSDWDKATSVLVISLILSYPMSFTLIVPFAFQNLYLVGKKNRIFFGNKKPFSYPLGKSKTIFIDKLETVTENSMNVEYSTIDKKFLPLIKTIEEISVHMMGKTINSFLSNYDFVSKKDYEEISDLNGLGMSIKTHKDKYYIGSYKCFMKYSDKKKIVDEKKIKSELEKGKKIIYFFTKKEFLGYFVLSYKIRNSTLEFIKKCKSRNIEPILISGDSKESTEFVANKIGVKNFYYDLDKDGKLKLVDKFKKLGAEIMYVGNHVSNVEAFRESQISFSTFSSSYFSKASADVIILNDDLSNVFKAYDLYYNARRKMGLGVILNIFFSISALAVSLSGILTLGMATLILIIADFYPIIFTLTIRFPRKKILK